MKAAKRLRPCVCLLPEALRLKCHWSVACGRLPAGLAVATAAAAVAATSAAAAANAAAAMESSPSNPRVAWAPVMLMLLIGIGFAIGNILISVMVGPGQTGPGKETTYESGMVPVGDTRKRFNVRFYIVAMIFLVFDVEIVFMYPWATIFAPASQTGTVGSTDLGLLLLVEMFVFVAILLLAYFYAWGKGVFRWD